jgi:hypothetical protein
MSVVDGSFDHPMKLEEEASMPFAGGIMQYGFQCGMIWGAVFAAGAQAYHLDGPGPQAETKAILAAQRLSESFRVSNKSINCVDITKLNISSSPKDMAIHFLVKGGMIGCFRMAARYAPVAFDEIKAGLSEKLMEVPSAPVSCAAVLAQKMGASDLHTVMTAGLAGGIGLCGGACGALGAALWLMAMKSSTDGNGKVDFNNPKASEMVDKFVECTEYEFQCVEIVGRRFENVGDHAMYLRNGGCSNIIEVLAQEMQSSLSNNSGT